MPRIWPRVRSAVSLAFNSRPFVFLLLFGLFLQSGCGHMGPAPEAAAGAAPSALNLQGSVFGGQQPISQALVQLYSVGTTGDGSAATPLISATVRTLANGTFTITGDYTCPSSGDPDVYITAKGGNPGLAPGTDNEGALMIAALGHCSTLTSGTFINMNELTTLAATYTLAPFMTAYDHIGSDTTDASALDSAFTQASVLVNTATGKAPGPTPPQNGFTVPVSKMNTLADATAACVNSVGGVANDGSACGNLYLYATPPSGAAPTDVAQALRNIASYPYQNVSNIFNLQSSIAPFQPVLSSAPSDWTVVTIPAITLAASSTPVGAGGSATGTITLGAAAPASGLTVTLTSSDTTILTVASPVTIASGQTTGSFTYTGVASGSATVTASAPSYSPGTISISPLGATLRIADPGSLTPGTTASLGVSLSSALSTSTTVTLAISNANPTGDISVSPTIVTIPAGSTTPTSSPVITPNQVGTATVTATAPGLNSPTRNLSSTITATLASPVTIGPGASTQTITLSTAAPTGGITFTLASSNTAVATVPASVTVPAGNSNTTFTLTGVAAGTANITASSYNITTATSAVTVVASINAHPLTTGFHLQDTTYVQLNVAPPSPVNVTVTSANPAVALLSTSATVAGSASVTFTGVSNTSALIFYVQALAQGTTTYSVTATGYTATTGSITVNPAGFYIRNCGSGSYSTTTLSADTQCYMQAVVLDPSTHNELFQSGIIPQIAPLSVTLTSSNTAVVTVPSTTTVSAGSDTSSYFAIHPAGTGTATVTLNEPTGFTAPVSNNDPTVLNVTVTPPTIASPDEDTGVHGETQYYFNLQQGPPATVTATVTIADPSIAVISMSATTVGTTTLTFPGITGTYNQFFYLQGKAFGTTTITITVPGYAAKTVNVTINHSGFIYNIGNINTTTFSSASGLQLTLRELDVNNNPGGGLSLSPDVAPLTIPITNSNTSAGTVTNPVYNAGDSYNSVGSYQPSQAGTGTLTIVQPAGFTVPTYGTVINTTVTAPGIADVSATTAYKAQIQDYTYLATNPPSARTVTLTVADTSIAKISTSNSTVGSGTITFTNITDTSRLYFWVQGQAQGSTTVTISSPGYATQTSTITVYPSGFYLSSGDYTTSLFSGTSTPQLSFVALAPGSLNPQFFPILNPDAAPVNVVVTSSNTSVGTISSPTTFQVGDTTKYLTFTPASVGTTTLTVVAPAGFSTSSYEATANITVTPGTINSSGGATIGTHLQDTPYFSLNQNPPSATAVTITVADPTVALLSKDGLSVGTASITYSLTDTSRIYFYVQGKALGNTSYTITANGYTSVPAQGITVERSGFVIGSGNFTTSAGGTNVSIDVQSWSVRSDGNFDSPQRVSPDVEPLTVNITSSNPAVGTFAPTTFHAGDNYYVHGTFTSGSAGQTLLTIQQPSGFTTPIQEQSLTATVQ